MTPPPLANERVALYRRVLGEAWDSLPEPLRAMHDLDGERSADGVAVVERGSGLLARLVAFVIGLPPAGADIYLAGASMTGARFRKAPAAPSRVV